MTISPAASRPNNVMDLKTIDNRIRGISTSAKNLRESSQDVAIAVMRHCVGEGRGDCTRALRLVKVLPVRLQTQMITFFSSFSPIRVTINKKEPAKDSVRLAKPDSKGYVEWNIDAALAVNWQDFNKEKVSKKKEFSLSSFRADIQKLVKKYNDLAKADLADDSEGILLDIAALHETFQACGRREATPLADAPRLVANGGSSILPF